MCNDLISRKAFLDELKLYCNRTFLGEITSSSEISVGELSTIIKKLPTTYDIIGKASQELNKCMKEAEESWKEFDDEQAFGEMMAYQRAIKIVKEAMNSE